MELWNRLSEVEGLILSYGAGEKADGAGCSRSDGARAPSATAWGSEGSCGRGVWSHKRKLDTQQLTKIIPKITPKGEQHQKKKKKVLCKHIKDNLAEE